MTTTQASDLGVDAYISGLAPERQGLFSDLRKLVREAAPAAKETMKCGYPCYEQHENVCSVMPADGYLRVQFFRGAELDDPNDLLEGRGKGMRHVKVRSTADIPKRALWALVEQAISLDANR